MFLLLFVSIALKLTSTVAVDVTAQGALPEHTKQEARKVFHSVHLSKSVNSSYPFVESDNVVRIPDIDNHTLQSKLPKKRKYKKSPRRTIQKIIKKVRKAKKTLNQLTSVPTTEIPYEEKEEQQELDEIQTTQAVPKKKTKKWKGKIARYPMPFSKLQPFRKDTLSTHGRFRRNDDEQRKLYILQDFDEIRFLGNENGNTAVKAHVKKYW